MSDTAQPKQVSVLERMIGAGISEEVARDSLAAGWVRVDDNVVTDPGHPATRPAVVMINSINAWGIQPN